VARVKTGKGKVLIMKVAFAIFVIIIATAIFRFQMHNDHSQNTRMCFGSKHGETQQVEPTLALAEDCIGGD